MSPAGNRNYRPQLMISLLGEGRCVRFISAFKGSPEVTVRTLECEGDDWVSTIMNRADAESLYRELIGKGYRQPVPDPGLLRKMIRLAALPVEGNGRYS
jgi:hypothetical protein